MKNTKTLTRVALLVAIELVMKMVGLGSVPVGPLYMSFRHNKFHSNQVPDVESFVPSRELCF